jgi:hypothetical protein
MNSKDLHEYAWNWFEYHASQRLTAFRFFLVFLGALIVGFGAGLKDGHCHFASAVGWFGAFISLAFLILEFRNEQLVNVSRDALMHLEQTDETFKAQPKLQLVHIDRARSGWWSYKFWLRAIYVLCIVLFLVGATNPKIVLATC